MTRRNNRRSAVSRRAIRTNANRQRLNCAVEDPALEALRNNAELTGRYTADEIDAILEAAEWHMLDPEDVLKAEIFFFPDCKDMSEVAWESLNDLGTFDGDNEWMKNYFDFAKYGDAMEYEGYWYYHRPIKGFVQFVF